MKNTFLQLNEHVSSSNAAQSHPGLTIYLNETMHTILALAQTASINSEEDEVFITLDQATSHQTPQQEQNETESCLQGQRRGAALSNYPPSVTKDGITDDVSAHDAGCADPAATHSDSHPAHPQHMPSSYFTALQQDSEAGPCQWPLQLHSYKSVAKPLTEAPVHLLPLDPPSTFSYQERTFARRLHRATLERGYQLLLNPNVPNEMKSRTFNLSFGFDNNDDVISRLKSTLRRTTEESLDWSFPRYVQCLGPEKQCNRQEIRAEVVRSGDGWEVRPVGGQNPEHRFQGFAWGKWYDSQDVANYLLERGVRIEPSASFAEMDIMDEPYPGMESLPSLSSSSSYSHAGGPLDFPTSPPGTPPVETAAVSIGLTGGGLFTDHSAPVNRDCFGMQPYVNGAVHVHHSGNISQPHGSSGFAGQLMPNSTITHDADQRRERRRKGTVVFDVAKFLDSKLHTRPPSASGLCMLIWRDRNHQQGHLSGPGSWLPQAGH